MRVWVPEKYPCLKYHIWVSVFRRRCHCGAGLSSNNDTRQLFTLYAIVPSYRPHVSDTDAADLLRTLVILVS